MVPRELSSCGSTGCLSRRLTWANRRKPKAVRLTRLIKLLTGSVGPLVTRAWCRGEYTGVRELVEFGGRPMPTVR